MNEEASWRSHPFRASRAAWTSPVRGLHYPSLSGDASFDVAVIGGGIAGLTAALLLKRAGLSVAVLEKSTIGGGESGHTTAHITEIIDTRYYDLIETFGVKRARLARESSAAAIDRIEAFVRELGIDCSFTRVPGFLYCELRKQSGELFREMDAFRRVGLGSSRWQESVPVPFATFGGIRVPNQAQFHPGLYYEGLARAIEGGGCRIFEHTFCRDVIDGSPCEVQSDNGTIRAQRVLVLTNSPISSRFFLHSKIFNYRTYVIAATYKGELEPGLFWDNADPYHYTRTQEMPDGRTLVIIGGEDHKTGMRRETGECLEGLESWARERFPLEQVRYRWSGQIVEPLDGLPYIGLNPLSKRVYIATGFSGNGMTFGTIAAMVLSDEILGRENPWATLYDARRVTVRASTALEFLRENKDYPACLIGDRVFPDGISSANELGRGKGATLRVGDRTLALYRNTHGGLEAVSAACTHLGCHVRFNAAERSWDCPCHGSRFNTEGEVLNGPATAGLERIEVEEIRKPQEERVRRRRRAA